MVLLPLGFIHVASADGSEPIIPHGVNDEQVAACVGSTHHNSSLFGCGVSLDIVIEERLILQSLLRLKWSDAMLLPILPDVAVVPLDSIVTVNDTHPANIRRAVCFFANCPSKSP